jgi:hypothetical protein
MKSVKYLYNDQSIEFIQGESNIMVNATQMAKIFNKRLDFFLKSENTKAFIEELELTLFGNDSTKNESEFPPYGGNSTQKNSEFPPYGGNSKSKLRDKIIKTRGKSGTFMHRVLALKLAAWLSPKFEVWVFFTIDKIIHAQFQNIKETTVEKIKLEKERDKLKDELLEKHPDDFYKFLELEGKLTKADRKRLKAIRESTQELRLSLFPEDITKI